MEEHMEKPRRLFLLLVEVDEPTTPTTFAEFANDVIGAHNAERNPPPFVRPNIGVPDDDTSQAVLDEA